MELCNRTWALASEKVLGTWLDDVLVLGLGREQRDLCSTQSLENESEKEASIQAVYDVKSVAAIVATCQRQSD